MTPDAVIAAAKALRYTEDKATVILVSDGRETCERDPCAVGRELEAAGVDTVPELAQRNAANLTAKMTEVNAKKKLVRQLPPESRVTDWVKQAKKLKRVISH